MKTSDFDYSLPADRIAQRPVEPRDRSRLLLLDRPERTWQDHSFCEFPDLLRGDELLVVNNARVLPARLFARRLGVRAMPPGRHSRARREFLSAPIEVLLTRQIDRNVWEALVRPGRKMLTGERASIGDGELEVEVIGQGEFGLRRLRFSGAENLPGLLERIGHVPLPPYIDRGDEPADRRSYQTIFARVDGAVACPTAGLHFTESVLARLRARGIEIAELTLQVGLGTFQPIHSERVEDHRMHGETYEIPEGVAGQLARARRDGRPIVAVGTTVVRALEDAAMKFAAGQLGGTAVTKVKAGKAEADLFIYPGHSFRIVDQLLTNFHLPRSSLLVLVAAFAGRELLLAAYQHAIAVSYRFYSYGDCMLVR